MQSIAIKAAMNLNLTSNDLKNLVMKFEAIFGLENAVAVFDAADQLVYGASNDDVLPEYREIIYVNNQPVGSVAVYCSGADPILQRTLTFFATSLSQLAQEAQRRDEMADEVLARYDELNLIYELGSKFAQGVAQEEIVQFVLMETNRIVQADAGVIYLWDSEKSNITPVSHFGNKSTADFWGGRLRELALSTLYAYDQAQLFESDRVICAPLRFNDELLGSLLLIYEREDNRFQASDINLLTTLTQNTALFIYVARLVAKLAHEKAELEKTLKELQATKDKLSQNERLTIVGQTVGSLIHDMRKPLSNVMGYAGLLQETDLTHEERFEFAGQIIKYIEVFSSMAQEVLDYTSGDAGVNKSLTSVETFMTYVADLLNPPGLARDTKIIITYDSAKDFTISVDAQRFVRVFQNLVNNSVDAIETQGGSQVELRVEAVGNMIRFVVEDDGPGVPEKIIDTLFQPFVTMGKSNGTGLGLAIVDRMVMAHGGKIRYETSRMGGARFVFSIPQA
ncbi:MAG: hypothetical protein GC179_03745 [Anaerolineaceae bacterium]|nr:hypothetical protein [Anaerolineaceae bacterium]